MNTAKVRIFSLFFCFILALSLFPIQGQCGEGAYHIPGAQREYDEYYGTVYVITVPSTQYFFDFSEICTWNIPWFVSTDLEGNHTVESKRAVLEPGDNLFFLTLRENNVTYNYTLVIRKTNEYENKPYTGETSIFGVEYDRLTTVFTWGNGTNVRALPNTHCEIVGVMNRGDSCTMLGFSEDKEWVKVIYGGQVAYIKKNLLILPVSVWLIMNNDTIAYDGPGVNYTQVWLPRGIELEWYGSSTEDDGYFICGYHDSVIYIPMANDISLTPCPMDRMPFNPVRLLSRFFAKITLREISDGGNMIVDQYD